jgi:GNAT superfamily N-acetyltransferase
MASGLPSPAYNNADVHDPEVVDVDALVEWYAPRAVPWGVRVPAGAAWNAGRFLFRKSLSALEAAGFVPAPRVDGLEVVTATSDDLAEVAAVDVAAFGGSVPEASAWLRPLVAAPRTHVLLARLDGRAVATAYTIRTDGEVGPAAYLGGVGVVPAARRRGIAGDLSSRILEAAFDAGADLAHCHPESGEASRVYERLGFEPAGAFDVYVDLA